MEILRQPFPQLRKRRAERLRRFAFPDRPGRRLGAFFFLFVFFLLAAKRLTCDLEEILDEFSEVLPKIAGGAVGTGRRHDFAKPRPARLESFYRAANVVDV